MIDPSFFMHYIHALEDAKLSREMQRRLIYMMKGVVKKEVIKWSDLVQVVPKNARLTVV